MDRYTIDNMDNATRNRYKAFEKRANAPFKQSNRKFFLISYSISAILIFLIMYNSLVFSLQLSLLIALTISVPIAILMLYKALGGKRHFKLIKYEQTEGVSDNTLKYAYELYNSPKTPVGVKAFYLMVISNYHNTRGEFHEALELLSKIPQKQFIRSPYLANSFYSALLEAYSSKGDLENAEKTYNDGAYYIETYINNSVCGLGMRFSLATYAHLKGNYEQSIKLLEDGLKLKLNSYTKKAKALTETNITQAYYRIVLSYACMGEKENALEALKQTDGKLCMPFFRTCIDKLYADLTNTNTNTYTGGNTNE